VDESPEKEFLNNDFNVKKTCQWKNRYYCKTYCFISCKKTSLQNLL